MDGVTNMVTATQTQTAQNSWSELSGQWFFAWRMAAACEDALKEVHQAMARQKDPERVEALEKVSSLLRRELQRWIRRGEALDMIVDHLPKKAE
jgi:predicted helicase